MAPLQDIHPSIFQMLPIFSLLYFFDYSLNVFLFSILFNFHVTKWEVICPQLHCNSHWMQRPCLRLLGTEYIGLEKIICSLIHLQSFTYSATFNDHLLCARRVNVILYHVIWFSKCFNSPQNFHVNTFEDKSHFSFHLFLYNVTQLDSVTYLPHWDSQRFCFCQKLEIMIFPFSSHYETEREGEDNVLLASSYFKTSEKNNWKIWAKEINRSSFPSPLLLLNLAQCFAILNTEKIDWMLNERILKTIAEICQHRNKKHSN